jgi:hypothetical protein
MKESVDAKHSAVCRIELFRRAMRLPYMWDYRPEPHGGGYKSLEFER